MIYKTKRTAKITDTVELCSDDGKAVKSIEVKLDADMIGQELLKHWNTLSDLTAKLKKAQNAYDKSEFYRLVEAYTSTIDVLFGMIFGEKNRIVIYEFFEGSYTEMVQQLVPYIFRRVLPAVRASVKEHKNDLRKAFK